MYILIILFFINVCSAFNLTKLRKHLNNPIHDYNNFETPNWVYKNVYNHNKKYNKVTKKILNKHISIDDEYELIKYYKLPLGLLQPINKV